VGVRVSIGVLFSRHHRQDEIVLGQVRHHQHRGDVNGDEPQQRVGISVADLLAGAARRD
jgi:hypothetical protein